MKYFGLCLVFVSVLCIYTCCSSKRNLLATQYLYDSTEVFSLHKSRPFKYGFAYSKQETKDFYLQELASINLKKGDVVADIGAASGWLEGIMSVFHDSITFYVQDINKVYLNEHELRKVIEHYSAFRDRPQTNKFIMKIGSKRKTNLPSATFDKILLLNSFHEFKDKKAILKEIKRCLKDSGQVILVDNFSNQYRNIRHEGCNKWLDKSRDLIFMFYESGLYITKSEQPENSLWNQLTFEKNAKRSEKYYEEKNKLKTIIEQLDRLNEPAVSKDSLATFTIANYLKDNTTELQKGFKDVIRYISALSYMYTEKK